MIQSIYHMMLVSQFSTALYVTSTYKKERLTNKKKVYMHVTLNHIE